MCQRFLPEEAGRAFLLAFAEWAAGAFPVFLPAFWEVPPFALFPLPDAVDLAGFPGALEAEV